MAKLVVVIMGQNCEKFIGMCLESVKDADEIVYCDGGSTDGTFDIWNKFIGGPQEEPAKYNIISNSYDQDDPKMNGKQRNFYLDYIKKNYPGWYCLCLDADEVCGDINKVKEFIQTAEPGLYSPVMRHFIGSLGWEDATQKTHYVPNRLFKISEAKEYPLESHPILIGKEIGVTDCTVVWHLGHLPVLYLDYILKRYKEHSDNSTIHTKQFLEQWKECHMFGLYPVKKIDPIEIPKQILERYELNPDKFYFQSRQMEVKHWIDIYNWKGYFKLGDKDGI